MKAIVILDDVPDWQTGEEVTVFFPDTMCKRGKCIAVLDDEGYRDAKRIFERPQGEWIDTGEMEEYWAEEYQCSICGEKDHWRNFCPHCGAKIKEV